MFNLQILGDIIASSAGVQTAPLSPVNTVNAKGHGGAVHKAGPGDGHLDTRCADGKHTAEGLRTLDPRIMNAIFSEYLGDHSNLSK